MFKKISKQNEEKIGGTLRNPDGRRRNRKRNKSHLISAAHSNSSSGYLTDFMNTQLPQITKKEFSIYIKLEFWGNYTQIMLVEMLPRRGNVWVTHSHASIKIVHSNLFDKNTELLPIKKSS